jgi:hypothetical protein
MNPELRKYLAEIGRKGGQRSRRTLDPQTARDMVRVREARKSFRRFHALCFWSSPPDLQIGKNDIDWVASELRKNGNRDAWEVAARLCP